MPLLNMKKKTVYVCCVKYRGIMLTCGILMINYVSLLKIRLIFIPIFKKSDASYIKR